MPRLGPADFPCPEPVGLVQDADDYQRQFGIKNLFAEKVSTQSIENENHKIINLANILYF